MSFVTDMFIEFGFAFCVPEVFPMFFESCVEVSVGSSYIKFVAVGACQFINPLPVVFIVLFVLFCRHLCAASSGEVLPALFNTVIGGRRRELDCNLADVFVLEVHLLHPPSLLGYCCCCCRCCWSSLLNSNLDQSTSPTTIGVGLYDTQSSQTVHGQKKIPAATTVVVLRG